MLKSIAIIEQILFASILILVIWDVIPYIFLHLALFITTSYIYILIIIRKNISIIVSFLGVFILLTFFIFVINFKIYTLSFFLSIVLIIISIYLTNLLIKFINSK